MTRVTRGRGAGRLMVLLLAAAALWTSEPAMAQFRLSLGYDAQHSDNIARAPHDARSELTHVLASDVEWLQQSRWLMADVTGSAQYEHYQHGTYGDQTLYDMNGRVVGNLLPGRLAWTLEDHARQARIDQLNPASPGNIQNENALWTGPDAFVPLDPIHQLELSARYGDLYYSDSEIGNKRYQGAARLYRQESPFTRLSLNAEATRVRYDNSSVAADQDYRREDYYFGLTREPPRSRVGIRLGRSYLKRDNGQRLDGSMIRVDLARRLSRVLTAGMNASSELTDAGLALLGAAPSTPGEGAQAPVAEIYRDRVAELYLTRSTDAGFQDFRIRAEKQQYPGLPLDQLQRSANLALGWKLGGAMTLQTAASFIETRYEDIGQRDDDMQASVTLVRYLSRNIATRFEVAHYRRDSSNGLTDFHETQVMVGIVWRPIERRPYSDPFATRIGPMRMEQ